MRATPFLYWGKDKPRLGWWIAAFAIDPFDSDHAAYATGATIYATNDFPNVNKEGATTHWQPWVEGIEQTAIITLCSPTDGAHLLSGFGDIGGQIRIRIHRARPMAGRKARQTGRVGGEFPQVRFAVWCRIVDTCHDAHPMGVLGGAVNGER